MILLTATSHRGSAGDNDALQSLTFPKSSRLGKPCAIWSAPACKHASRDLTFSCRVAACRDMVRALRGVFMSGGDGLSRSRSHLTVRPSCDVSPSALAILPRLTGLSKVSSSPAARKCGLLPDLFTLGFATAAVTPTPGAARVDDSAAADLGCSALSPDILRIFAVGLGGRLSSL